jgi:hypothetical protein
MHRNGKGNPPTNYIKARDPIRLLLWGPGLSIASDRVLCYASTAWQEAGASWSAASVVVAAGITGAVPDEPGSRRANRASCDGATTIGMVIGEE